MIMATSAPPALTYATSILKPFSLILLTAGPMYPQFSIGDLIFKGMMVAGTKNGTAQDLEEATALCLREGIRSQVKTYRFEQQGMDQLIKDTHQPDWKGKAVVVMP